MDRKSRIINSLYVLFDYLKGTRAYNYSGGTSKKYALIQSTEELKLSSENVVFRLSACGLFVAHVSVTSIITPFIFCLLMLPSCKLYLSFNLLVLFCLSICSSVWLLNLPVCLCPPPCLSMCLCVSVCLCGCLSIYLS